MSSTMIKTSVVTLGTVFGGAVLLLSVPAAAQQAPDTGQILREVAPPTLQAPHPGPALDLQAPSSSAVSPGGAKVTLQGVVFTGNTIFSEDELRSVVGDVAGQQLDLAGLQALAASVTDHYRANAYPFARAAVARQEMTDGVLVLTVIEGRYGAVSAVGDADLVDGAETFLAPLQQGSVIQSADLERATLILDDQAGVKTSPIVRPGQDLGTGDLVVTVIRDRLVTGDMGVDNHGGRYTGYHRARVNLQINSPFMVGDQITVRGLASDRDLYLGSLGYSAPLGGDGLRGQVSVSHTAYQLGQEFRSLEATGEATVYAAGLSYPLLRSQAANLTLGGAYQYKDLQDKTGQTNTSNTKSSHSLPVVLQFDRRDGFLGGGITYGALTWTGGSVHLNGAQHAVDQQTARTHGAFHKVNLDIARLQALPSSFSVHGRFSGQLAGKNLDSSEGFSLGGPNGVRAYPAGEATGDEGWLAQAELRYDLSPVTPYVFFDAGGVRVNADPWQADTNTRDIAGAGFGVRVSYEGWLFDGTAAWRTQGGRPQSDTSDRLPQVWVNAGYAF